MEVAGPLGTPLGLAQRKRASPRGEAPGPPRRPFPVPRPDAHTRLLLFTVVAPEVETWHNKTKGEMTEEISELFSMVENIEQRNIERLCEVHPSRCLGGRGVDG